MGKLIALVAFIMAVFWAAGWDEFNVLGIGMFSFYALLLATKLTTTLAFREFLLVLYGINYLLSPAITYQFGFDVGSYRMKIGNAEYFGMMIPAFAMLHLGLYLIRTRIFDTDFRLVKINAYINEQVLKQWLLLGVACIFLRPMVPGELGFFIYLTGLIRYVAAFALYYIDRKKYWLYLVIVLAMEVYASILHGMFHDTMMWFIFFLLFLGLIFQYSLRQKVIMGSVTVLAFLFIQSVKVDYRNRIWGGGDAAGIGTFTSTASDALEGDDLFAEENLVGSLSRVNQAWIFASVVDNMDRTQDFQGLANVKLYFEAALLPRFLAPNKIISGDKVIFNRFSGHVINEGTSMGLGILADGYIAYAYWGVLIFALCFGLLFGGIFKIVEQWTRISPFFVLFIFPILNYAVRPDCETQTILGHIVKSVLVYGCFMIFYKQYFNKKITFMEKTNLRGEKPEARNSISESKA